jgi:environmental stress-induced protein Ves
MKTRLLAPRDYRAMPWKNGLGITHEIALERSAEEEQFGTFVWRLSMAEVGTSAPFSRFPGCDRTILLLDGQGMMLDSGSDGRHLLDQKFRPYSFGGEWQTEGTLIDGPCLDFNIMVDRSRARADVSVKTLSCTPQPLSLRGNLLAVFALAGTVQLRTEEPPHSHTIPTRHTLLVEPESAAALSGWLTAQQQDATVLLIEIARHRA